MNDQKKEITVNFEIEGNEIKLTPSIVQNFLLNGNSKITMQDFKFFTEICKCRGLNPFLKEAYLIKYGNNSAQIIVSKDVYLKRAVKNKDYDGHISGIIVLKSNGDIERREGGFYLPDCEKLVGGWCKVFKKSISHAIYCSVPLHEIEQRKNNGDANSMWSTKTAMMCEKVAKSRALREAFVEDLSGLYIQDEFEEFEERKEEAVVEQSEPVQEDGYQSERDDEIIDINDI